MVLEEVFMPATYTHHLFTKDVYQSIDSHIQNKINIDLFNVFGKSFDAFFFYRPKIGSFAHKNNANLYFANIIYYLREHKLTDHSDLLSYLYGSICHYVLDSTAHPFIYYYGGKYDRKNKKMRKYRGKHDYIELMIDALMCYDREYKPIQQCSISKKAFPKVKFSQELFLILDSVYLDTFQIKNGGKLYYKSYKKFRFIFKHFMSSRFGFKNMFYTFFDWVPLLPVQLHNYCYYVKKVDKSVLNLEHKKWYYPVDKRISYHYSFYDLYDVAVIKAVKLITLIDDALDKDEKTVKKAIKEIGNLGYSTGVNENRKVTMKYFVN